MKVINIEGTSDNTCNCGSWLAHWEKITGKRAGYCAATGCTENNPNNLVGAHVQKEGSDMNWYIIPLCKGHNQKVSAFDIFNGTPLVSANKKETCENH